MSTAKDIATGGISAIGSLVGIGGKEKSGTASDLDNTDYCKLALAGQPLVRSKPKSPATAPATTEAPAAEKQPPPGGSTMDKIDKKLEGLGKDLGGALKGLFGK